MRLRLSKDHHFSPFDSCGNMDCAKLVDDHGEPTSLDFDGKKLSYYWSDTTLHLDVVKAKEGVFRVLWNDKLISEGPFPTSWFDWKTSARLFWAKERETQEVKRELMTEFVTNPKTCWDVFRACTMEHAEDFMPGVW